ncbi:MAG: hypothetical protein PHF44_03205 [Candidatus Pacebacteria bacterium]|nr:hypothetical protein [Candidatus Paceibacterota bacterium]
MKKIIEFPAKIFAFGIYSLVRAICVAPKKGSPDPLGVDSFTDIPRRFSFRFENRYVTVIGSNTDEVIKNLRRELTLSEALVAGYNLEEIRKIVESKFKCEKASEREMFLASNGHS